MNQCVGIEHDITLTKPLLNAKTIILWGDVLIHFQNYIMTCNIKQVSYVILLIQHQTLKFINATI
jgi:hypothetical protein